MITIRMNGVTDTVARLRDIARRTPDAAAYALVKFGEPVRDKSADKAPVDEADLKGTATLEPVQKSGNRISVAITFGAHGIAEDYAIRQHEDLDYHHDIGQAKFLESTINESEATFGPEVARHVREFLGL